ncbi:hypothetical protein I7I53_05376 [Histoplasma capsulatum var. duboisii H88]|uniref:Uncharacterized protein n=3 Tax=Ajellomyces capsulatus TaxID=5037 RepID=A0A8A1LST8_AJEC8|nr:hypothetical protein I7I53_05376 [Histoplasma capsulatum var. duboisii H88]
MPATMPQSYHHQHILAPMPSSKSSGNGSNGPTGTGTTGTTASTTSNTNGASGINSKSFSTSTFTQEISRAMQASSSQQPKYAAYPRVMGDRFEHPPPPPPSPVGWSRS